MIKVKNISKSFILPHEKKMTLREHVLGFLSGRGTTEERLCALRGIDFDVQRGEFFSIIGKNGSGKSTLLKIMAHIYAPDEGGVTIDGTVSPFLELGIGFNPDLTARENVFLSASVMGLRRKEIENLYGRIISFAELERFQSQELKNFSSGMQVRLAFSVAFMVDADILLIDEVLAVGDASFQQKCYDVFRRLKAEGKTIVFVSHGMGEVKEFSDRVMLLHEGKIVSIGEPEKVVHDYQLLTAREDEKRIAMEESLKQREMAEVQRTLPSPGDEHRWGSGWARMKSVKLFDAEGREKHVFTTGEELCMRMGLERRKEDLASVQAKVSVHRSDGVNVLVTQSDPIRVDTPAGGTGRVVDLVFPKIELLAAIYYFDVALMPVDGGEPCDFLKSCCKMRIYQDSSGAYKSFGGISYLAHEWKIPEVSS
jgi:lipopolysaccharide transport system ATP-binding protein